jgi:hypothetical protein
MSHPKPASRWRGCRSRVAAITAALAGVSLLTAACGGGSASPGAAVTAEAVTATPTAGQAGSSLTADAGAYTRCMHVHGVPDFPDPNTQGKLFNSKYLQQAGVDPGSPPFRAASTACSRLFPDIPVP